MWDFVVMLLCNLSVRSLSLSFTNYLPLPRTLFHSLSLSLPVSFIHNSCYIDEGESVVTDKQERTNLFQVKWQTELALLFPSSAFFSTHFLQ